MVVNLKRNDYIVTEIKVEISCGELIDKLTILSIKSEKIKDKEGLENVQHEFKVPMKYPKS